MARMPMLELPHSSDCLVCGRSNPLGLKLSLFVDDQTDEVHCRYTPRREQLGFEGIIHGGVIATVADETMVWAATCRGKRFCVCGEMTVRFRQSVTVGQTLLFVAKVEFLRPRLIEVSARITDDATKALIATSSGKFVPVPPDQHNRFCMTMVEEPQTAPAVAYLRLPAVPHEAR